MASKGKIYYTDKDFSDAEVAALFGFPSIFILKNNSGQIVKHTAYDVTGAKSVTTFQASQDRVLTIGAITATTSSIDIALHSSGINSVEMNGNTRSKNTAEHWEFPEVTEEKVFQIYAEDTPAIFGLAEDGEEIPAGALIVATITLSESGEVVINEPIDGFQLKSNQAWVRTWVNYTTDIQTLSIHHAALRFIVQAGHDGVKIGGFQFYKPEFLYDGVEITLRNATLGDLELASATESGYNLVPINPADLPAKLKIGESCTLAYDAYTNVFNVQKMGSEPDLSGYATIVDLDTEEVNRAMADAALQSQVTSNTMTRSSVTDKMVHYWDQSVMRWISTGLNYVSNTLLEFAGKLKVKGLLIDETPDSIQARELKFRNNHLKFAKNDGIEKNVLLEGDAILDFDQFVANYMTDDIATMRPLGADYQNWNWTGSTVFQAGHSDPGFASGFVTNVIRYASSSAILGRQHGSPLGFDTILTFSVFRKFMIETNVPTQRVFVGYSDNWRATNFNPTNVPMTSLVQVLGICMESGNPNLLLVHNDFSGSATIVDTGFVHQAKYIYEFTISHEWGNQYLDVRLRRIDNTTGLTNEWTHQIISDYHANYMYYPALWCVDELNSATVRVLDFGLIRKQRTRYL